MNIKRDLILALTIICLMLLGGTFFYHHAEGWTYSDSFYFTGVTLLTIGYGDLAPTMPFTKVVTVVAGFMSIGLVLFSASLIVKSEREYLKKSFKKITRTNSKKKSK